MRNETGKNGYLVIGLILGDECTQVRDIVRRQAAPLVAASIVSGLNVCQPKGRRVGKYCYRAGMTQLSPLKTSPAGVSSIPLLALGTGPIGRPGRYDA